MKNVWLVKHPISQYNENVQAIAKEKGLRIIDAIFSDSIKPEQLAENQPKLTLKVQPNAESTLSEKEKKKAERKAAADAAAKAALDAEAQTKAAADAQAAAN